MTGVIGGVVGLTILLTTDLLAPALIAVSWGVLGMILLPLTRVCTRVFCSRAEWWGTPAVIITAGRSGDGILRTLRRWPEMGLRPVAVLSDTDPEAPHDHCLHGPIAQAPYLARKFSIPYALVALPTGSQIERAHLLLRYAKFFDHVIVLPDEPERTAFWTTGQSGEGLFGYSVRGAAARPGQGAAARCRGRPLVRRRRGRAALANGRAARRAPGAAAVSHPEPRDPGGFRRGSQRGAVRPRRPGGAARPGRPRGAGRLVQDQWGAVTTV